MAKYPPGSTRRTSVSSAVSSTRPRVRRARQRVSSAIVIVVLVPDSWIEIPRPRERTSQLNPFAGRTAAAARTSTTGAGDVGAAGSAGSALAQYAPAAVPQRFSSVAVDVDRLHALGLGPYAEFVRSALLAETRRAFADRIGRGGPRLVVRITGVHLSSFAGGGGDRHGGGIHSDSLDGEALVVGPRGEILARYPQLSATPAGSASAWYDPQSEKKRTLYLAQHYASWLRRTIGG